MYVHTYTGKQTRRMSVYRSCSMLCFGDLIRQQKHKQCLNDWKNSIKLRFMLKSCLELQPRGFPLVSGTTNGILMAVNMAMTNRMLKPIVSPNRFAITGNRDVMMAVHNQLAAKAIPSPNPRHLSVNISAPKENSGGPQQLMKVKIITAMLTTASGRRASPNSGFGVGVKRHDARAIDELSVCVLLTGVSVSITPK